MERKSILYDNKKLSGKDLLEARKLEYTKLNDSFLFKLEDGQFFFISYYFDDNIDLDRIDRIILQPNNQILNKVLRFTEKLSFPNYLFINISGDQNISVMHLLDALLIILKSLNIGLKYNFEAYDFKIIEDSEVSKVVLDTDLQSNKQITLVKAGTSHIFSLETVGEIDPDSLCDIVENCFE